MTTVLIWLGSGFAFSVGVFVGAYMMIWIRRKDEDTSKMSLELMRQRNELDRERNDHLNCIDDRLIGIGEWMKRGT